MRKKIKKNEFSNLRDNKSPQAYEEPIGEIEEELARIWAGIIKIGLIGRNDNFFELGGNSLQAARIINKIYEDFRIELPIRTIFDLQTVKDLARKIEDTYDEAFSGDMDEGVI